MRGFESRPGLMDNVRIVLGALSGILLVAGSIPYIRDVINKTTRPNVVSWGGWTLFSAIVAVAQIAKGADMSVLVPIGSTLGTGIVAVLGIKYGYVQFSKLDKVCFMLGAAAIAIWFVTGEPLTAIVIAIIADAFFLLPTSVKAYRTPLTETALSYVLYIVASIFGLLALTDLRLQNVLFPIYLIFAYGSTVIILLVRRKLT